MKKKKRVSKIDQIAFESTKREEYQPEQVDKYRGVELAPQSDVPWDRLTDPLSPYNRDPRHSAETSSDHFIFINYLMLPPPVRSIKNLQDALERETGKRPSYEFINKLKDCYSWEERVAAYDDHILGMRMDEHEEEIRQMNKYYSSCARKLTEAYMLLHEAYLKKLEKPDEVIEQLAKMDVVKLMREMDRHTWAMKQNMEMERMAHGLSTENVAINQKVSGEVKIKIEDFRKRMKEKEEELKNE